MACGTGKTLTALWIAEKMKSRRTLVLVPSLLLIAQTLHEWTRTCRTPLDPIVVCSDKTVRTKGDDPAIASASELAVPVTTSVKDIQLFLSTRRRGRHAVVICTYQSSPVIQQAQKASPLFDLIVADESHRCAGHVKGAFATVLDDTKIKGRKRLFMTGTPRYFQDRVKKRAKMLDYELASMDDISQFGPEFHRLSFGAAVRADLLTDYQVVVIGVTDTDVHELVEKGRLVRTTSGVETDARTLASHIGLAKAMRKHRLRKIISFHSTVMKASRFVDIQQEDSFPSTLSRLSSSSKPSGRLWAEHISGNTRASKRKTLLKYFGDLPKQMRGIVSNCFCLSEGVDVPTLDGVVFMEPRHSVLGIMQAVGRVIRKADDKKVGTVVIPVFTRESDDKDETLEAFETVWSVLRTLKAHDELLAIQLDELRFKIGKCHSRRWKVRLPTKIRIDIPTIVGKDFEQTFCVRTVRETISSDRETLGILKSHIVEHGGKSVKRGKVVSGIDLDLWVVQKRKHFMRGVLPQWLREELESIPNWSWDPVGDARRKNLRLLHAFINDYGLESLDIYTEVDGVKIGSWCADCRKRRKNGELEPWLRDQLDNIPGWTWEVARDQWLESLNKLQQFIEKYGWKMLSQKKTIVAGLRLGYWVSDQRRRYRRESLKQWQVDRLESVPGWSWGVPAKERSHVSLETRLGEFERFVQKNGIQAVLKVPDSKGASLASWAVGVRRRYKEGKLPESVVVRLDSIPGWSWTPKEETVEGKLTLLRKFVAAHGWDALRKTTIFEGVEIGAWVTQCRSSYNQGRLSNERVKELEAIPGWLWDPKNDAHRRNLNLLRSYVTENGWRGFTSKTVVKNVKLGTWFSERRKAFKKGKLPKWLERELLSIPGCSFDPFRDRHVRSLAIVREFLGLRGWDGVKRGVVFKGLNIEQWIKNPRKNFKSDVLRSWLCEEIETLPDWKW